MSNKNDSFRVSDIPVMNYGKLVLEKLKAFKGQPAVIDAPSRRTYTFDEVISRTERLAAGLQRLGAQSGDVICTFAPNHIDYTTVAFATYLVNGILQCINPLFTKDDLNKVLKDCNTKYVITIPDLVHTVKAATNGLTENVKVIVFGDSKGCYSFESVLAPEGTPYIIPPTDCMKSTSTLMYSSGTTGFPKAVKHSHFTITANTVLISRTTIYTTGKNVVMFLPMFHGYGLLFSMITLYTGCTLIVMPRFDMDQYLELIQTYKPEILQVVPPIMVLFAKYPKVSHYDLSSVKRIVCAAAPLSAEIEDTVMKRLKLEDIQQGYGMTEVGITHMNTPKSSRQYSVGKLMELTEIKIVDVDTGRSLGLNQPGEVWVRGPQASLGYLNLPAQTKEMFLDDGWIRTGDIGKQDADRFLYIVDRLKELIKYKAFQVAPASLEDILLRHESVADAGVVGIPDEAAGELPRAYVVKRPGAQVTEKDIQDFVAGHVAPYMKLRGGVEFIQEIPRSQSGKILRRNLREIAKATRSNCDLTNIQHWIFRLMNVHLFKGHNIGPMARVCDVFNASI